MELIGSFTINNIIALFFVLGFGHNAFSETRSVCELINNKKVFLDENKTSESSVLTQNGTTSCAKINDNTYRILFHGVSRYVSSDAIKTERSHLRFATVKTAELNFLGFKSTKTSGGSNFGSKIIIVDDSVIIPTEKINLNTMSSSFTFGDLDMGKAKDSEEKPKSAAKVRLLKSAGWVETRTAPVKNSSFSCEVVVKGSCKAGRKQVAAIDHNVELNPTGERVYDEKNSEWYFKANFVHDKQSYSAWFPESKAESVDYELDKTLAQKKGTYLTNSSEGNSEVGTADGLKLKMSEKDVIERSKMSMGATVETILSAQANEALRDRAKTMFKTSKRNLLKLHNGRDGLCGSYDYSPTAGENSYVHPMTACVMAKMAQTWKEQYCPDGGICRLEIGNISHATKSHFNASKTHTDGYCFDMRPIKKRGEGPLTFRSSNYDRQQTKNLLQLLSRLGGTSESRRNDFELPIFNDSKIKNKDGSRLARTVRKHDDHIHVCFRPDNPTVQNQCASFEPNEKICTDRRSKTLFKHPLMEELKKI